MPHSLFLYISIGIPIAFNSLCSLGEERTTLLTALFSKPVIISLN